MTTAGLASQLLAQTSTTLHTELRTDLLDAAVRYARLRVDWALRDQAERRAIDATRTAAHDVLLDACNILSRAMGRSGESNAWRAALGTDRRVIGDVACHIHCLLGLSAA